MDSLVNISQLSKPQDFGLELLEREFRAFKEEITSMSPETIAEKPKSVSRGETTQGRQESFSADGCSEIFLQRNIATYCAIWFDQYHSWFPILHQPTVLETCQQYTDCPTALVPVVLKAIFAVIFPTQVAHISDTQLHKWTHDLEDDITLVSFHNLSLQSLQALLILTIPVFGSGRMAEFYNLMALCKRTQLGLGDLVNYHCTNFCIASAIPPRMLFPPLTAVEREEKIRAFWTTEALDSISTLGAAWNLSVSRHEPAATAPCDEEIWQYPESVLATYFFGNTNAPSSFSLFVSLATNELWQVHHFLQESYSSKASINFQQRKEDCDAVYQRLMSWLTDFEGILSISSPPYIDLFSEGSGQHPNSLLIRCTIHSAVISLYQRFIFPADGASDSGVSWICAADRCLESCDKMVVIVRAISDGILETINPHIIFCVFVAARFYVIYSRASNLVVPDKLYLLVYALTVAGKRWALAKQLKKVLDAATTESRSRSTGGHPLPAEFYDLQYLSWDIHDALRQWEQMEEAVWTQAVVSPSRG
ncbi:hypothetical protein N7474_007985 [Penicillium riverlandense]|uniref:uncharacterized protein n=1 Tax=Penicillium riverlandense TaxID=1903569 RepID=UPI0025495B2F|nr:uncharacterized protein N7474_007985 [Penicillium riverlandense]KAJ5811684.1 hypothetical protein N7474_007985 [Penicillium riverlandense]